MNYTEYLQQREELRRKRKEVIPESPQDEELRAQLDALEALKEKLGLQELTPALPPTPKPPRQSHADRDYFEQVDGNVTIYDTNGTTPVNVEGMRKAYLKRLLQITSRLDLSGIDRKAAGQNLDTCLNLHSIYTALLTLSADREDLELGVKAQGSEHRQEHRLSALTQVNQHQHLVLLGDPGSGKSTFVKFMAICLAGELLADERVNLARLTAPLPDKNDEQPEPQPWQHGPLLPVQVILREFAAKGLPSEGQTATAKDLWTFIAGTLEDALLGDYIPYLHTHLRDQGGLILLDGLDEVPEADRRRRQIKQAVEDFADHFPECRLVVTSRTYAYQQQEWRLTGFREAVLAPFNRNQIQFFVNHWYAHVADMRGMDRGNAQGRAELLKRAIFSSERLHDFAKRPLLLTLMASLHAWRGGSLPEKRGELYAEATDLLLDWWERHKIVQNASGERTMAQPSLSEVLRVGKDAVQGVLNTLAFEAHHSQTEMTGTADIAEERLIKELMHICRNDNVNPVLLVKHLSDRAGLLVSRGVGIYSFPHRTFQEYLAACHLTDQDDYPENVADLARQDPNRWREVVLLAGARAASAAPMIWALAEVLCYQNVHEGPVTLRDAWGALLAGSALVETAKLDPISPQNRPKVRRIREWLVAILTEQKPQDDPFPVVERALAGNLLAVLGDPRPGVGQQEDGLPDIVWCKVPAGTFLMGSDPEKDQEAYEDEQPQHTVQVSAFRISRYPVTNAQYQSFVKGGGYTDRWRECWEKEGWAWKEEEQISEPESYGREFDLPNHPIVGVSWYEASAFCRWLTIRWRECGELEKDQEIKLPTEAEWEKAARSDDGRIFPWGNDTITPERANYDDTGLGTSSAVGCFPQGVSPYKCEEMAGNVWEWCLDRCDYDKNFNMVTDTYKDGLVDPVSLSGSDRVLRGGSWRGDARLCRAAYRDRDAPDLRFGYAGFRLLRTPL